MRSNLCRFHNPPIFLAQRTQCRLYAHHKFLFQIHATCLSQNSTHTANLHARWTQIHEVSGCICPTPQCTCHHCTFILHWLEFFWWSQTSLENRQADRVINTSWQLFSLLVLETALWKPKIRSLPVFHIRSLSFIRARALLLHSRKRAISTNFQEFKLCARKPFGLQSKFYSPVQVLEVSSEDLLLESL